MRTIGTWATRSALDSPEDTAAALAASGVNMVSIMLNDFSGARSEQEFRTHSPEKVAAFADELHLLGIEVTLTTWVMPHGLFMLGMGEQLPALMELCGATMLVLDAEEPWVQATGALPHDDAAKIIAGELDGLRLALSGISYANTAALAGLSKVCPVWSPQAYATTNEGSMDPTKAVSGSLERWRSRFGEPDAWMMGLAAYAQPEPASLYMDPCLEQTQAAGIESVCYWSHARIIERPDVRDVLLRWSGSTSSKPVGPIFPPLGLADANDGRDRHVAQVQGLLVAAGQDIAIDGLRGPKTREAYAAVTGSTSTRVDWTALLT